MRSILQTNKFCFFCGNPKVDVHHVRLGNCSRETAEKYHLIAYLCREHHDSLHRNADMKLLLQQYAQIQFEAKHSHEEYMKIFKKNYLE